MNRAQSPTDSKRSATMARPVSTNPPAHGTRARYVSRSHPCRCVDCSQANAAGIRAWRMTGSTKGVPVQLALPDRTLTRRTDDG